MAIATATIYISRDYIVRPIIVHYIIIVTTAMNDNNLFADKIKEALHVLIWEKTRLNQQIQHANFYRFR